MMLDRRQLLMNFGAMASLLSMPGGAQHVIASEPIDLPRNYKHLDAVALAQWIQSGKISAAELTQVAINAIEKINPMINAVVTPLYDQATERVNNAKLPQGPFHGVPCLLKDLINLKGTRTTYGSQAMINNMAEDTHVFVAALQQSGLNILGKTNTPEFGLVTTTEPKALGVCKNPWDLSRSAGGSSGGAGAAVAAGMVPIAQASDGGGSIRIPAANCGVFGLKPSRGRNVSSGGGLNGLSVKGHISRTVRDSAALFAVTERRDANAPYRAVGYISGPSKRRLNIGLMMDDHFGQPPASDVREAIVKTADLCESLGHRVQEDRSMIDGRTLMDAFFVLWSNWPGKAVQRFKQAAGREPTTDDFEPWTLYLADYYHRTGKAAVNKALATMRQISEAFIRHFNQYDVLLSPVTASAPLPLGWHNGYVVGDKLRARLESYVSYTPIHNVAGIPAMSVPLFWNKNGLPIGSQFAAGPGKESVLFELAYQLEQARPWKQKWPTIVAV